MNSPSALVSSSWLDDQKVEILTICRDTFDHSDQSALYPYSSTIPKLILTSQNLQRVQNTQKDTCFVYVVNVLRKYQGAYQLLPNHYKSVDYLLVDIVIMSLVVQGFYSHYFELFIKGLWLVLSRQSNVTTISRRSLENRHMLTHDHKCQCPYELDRQQISILRHSQHIIDQCFLFLDSKILLLSLFFLDRRMAIVTMPHYGLGHSAQPRKGCIYIVL